VNNLEIFILKHVTLDIWSSESIPFILLFIFISAFLTAFVGLFVYSIYDDGNGMSKENSKKIKTITSIFFVIFMSICLILFYNDNKVDLKGPVDFNSKYNITTEEKDNIIELKYYKKPIFTNDDSMWNHFKISIKKTNSGKYYVFFNGNAEDKKEITEEDVKGTIENIRKSENYEFDEKAEKINLHELQQKDNKDSSKEISENKENKTNLFKYIIIIIVCSGLGYLLFKKDKKKKSIIEENTEITESKQKTTLKEFKESFLKNQNKWFSFVIERIIKNEEYRKLNSRIC